MTRRGSEIDAEKEIIKIIQKMQPCTFTEILNEKIMSKGTVGTYLKKTLKNGKVGVKIGEKNGRRTQIYSLTEIGEWFYSKIIVETFLYNINQPISISECFEEGEILVNITAQTNFEEKDHRQEEKEINALLQKFKLDTSELKKIIESKTNCYRISLSYNYTRK